MINPNIVQAANAYIVSQTKKTTSPLRNAVTRKTKPFITISRETGAGGTTLGGLLVDYLNSHDINSPLEWRLFGKNLIEKVIEDHKLPDIFRHYLTEGRVSEIEDTFETLMGLHPGMGQLAKKTCSTILNLASVGNVVLIGRGSNIITKNMPGGLHIRLIAEHEWKVMHVASLYNLSRKDASKYIEDEDNKRKEYVKKLFNKNVADPVMYDLVIKTSSISFDEAVELVAGKVLRFKQSQYMHANG